MRQRLITLVVGLAAAVVAAGALACGSKSASPQATPSSPTATTPPSATATVLTSSHPGARSPHCGTCPNCAFLIRQDGTIDTVQTWFDKDAMERAIRALAAR